MTAHRLSALMRKTAGKAGRVRGSVTFNEATGEVCDGACRSDARLDRARTFAISATLGYPPLT
ncbi:hypothetical protein Pmi06nite_21020 [Planotetraspora mira]|uniref:Uncharacterized protein n=2 Tax=Planotetraspora mira TaxID=58121 RepID=A0A8J3TK64_9ACTN|nr:hypothetical protein Pmi06nite_21020 [Planotetraspora mira]